VQVHRHFAGKHCLQLEGQGVCETSNKEEVNSTLLASCSLFGMFFMAALSHIQEDGHCYENLKSNFLVSPVWKNDSNGATRPLIISVSFFTSTINGVSVQMVFL
jgi:hypothetical protein